MAGIMQIVHEFFDQLNWILPVSVFTTVFLCRFPLLFHSHSYNPRNSATPPSSSSTQVTSPQTKSYAQTRSSCTIRCTSDEAGTSITGSGSEKLDYEFDQHKSMEWSELTLTRPHIQHPQTSKMSTSTLATSATSSSPLLTLPTEVQLLIFRYCAPIPSERQGPNSMDTFLTLLQVSKTVQQQAYIACLPHIPLALWSKRGVRSFQKLLLRKPELGCLVRYLWVGIGRLDEQELGWALDIMHSVSQLHSLACGEFFLASAVNAGVVAKTCQRVTLMGVEKDVEYQARGVRQVRLCTGVYSTKERFPDVTTLCFNARRVNVKDERVKVEYEIVNRWAEKVDKFVLIERDLRRTSSRGLDLKFKAKRNGRPDMFSVTLPARWTEWDIWSSDVVGEGVWDKCGLEGRGI